MLTLLKIQRAINSFELFRPTQLPKWLSLSFGILDTVILLLLFQLVGMHFYLKYKHMSTYEYIQAKKSEKKQREQEKNKQQNSDTESKLQQKNSTVAGIEDKSKTIMTLIPEQKLTMSSPKYNEKSSLNFEFSGIQSPNSFGNLKQQLQDIKSQKELSPKNLRKTLILSSFLQFANYKGNEIREETIVEITEEQEQQLQSKGEALSDRPIKSPKAFNKIEIEYEFKTQ